MGDPRPTWPKGCRALVSCAREKACLFGCDAHTGREIAGLVAQKLEPPMTTPDPTPEARAREIARKMAVEIGELTDRPLSDGIVRCLASVITAALTAARLEALEEAAGFADKSVAQLSRVSQGAQRKGDDNLMYRANTAYHHSVAIAAAIRQAKEG